jgi:hypothetical protein
MPTPEHDLDAADHRQREAHPGAASHHAFAALDADDGAWYGEDPLAPVVREADNVEG